MQRSPRRLGWCLGLVVLLVAGCWRSEPPNAVEEVSVAQSGPVQELPPPSVQPDDWPWWRGPGRDGIADAAARPVTEWSDSRNVLWKAAVPGRGHSSPTVVGGRVFLATADEDRKVQSVLAFDRRSGDALWQADLNAGGFPQVHTRNSHATGTIASDGERLFVALCHRQAIHAIALDLDGNELWRETVGKYEPRQFEYGYAPSPVIAGPLVIVAVDCDCGGYLAAYHRQSGRLVWRTARPVVQSYSSPVLAHVAGRDQLLISGCGLVASYHPQTGEPLWSAKATTSATCGTVVWDDERVFASGGYPSAGTYCVRADGSGEIVWQNREKCYEQSMLVHDGHLYAVNDGGIALCWNAADGTERWRRRLGGGVSASPVLARGHIYQTNENGITFVFRANPQRFDLVAENQLGGETFASPAICGDQIFLRVAERSSRRRQEWLFCVSGG